MGEVVGLEAFWRFLEMSWWFLFDVLKWTETAKNIQKQQRFERRCLVLWAQFEVKPSGSEFQGKMRSSPAQCGIPRGSKNHQNPIKSVHTYPEPNKKQWKHVETRQNPPANLQRWLLLHPYSFLTLERARGREQECLVNWCKTAWVRFFWTI